MKGRAMTTYTKDAVLIPFSIDTQKNGSNWLLFPDSLVKWVYEESFADPHLNDALSIPKSAPQVDQRNVLFLDTRMERCRRVAGRTLAQGGTLYIFAHGGYDDNWYFHESRFIRTGVWEVELKIRKLLKEVTGRITIDLRVCYSADRPTARKPKATQNQNDYIGMYTLAGRLANSLRDLVDEVYGQEGPGGPGVAYHKRGFTPKFVAQ
jgi:hypothetical protein